MKSKLVFFSALIVLTASLPASARKDTPRPFFLETSITMNGAQIPEGMYELSVEPSGSGVEVTLLREGQFYASARGAWVKSGVKFRDNAVLLRVNSDGTRSLVEIRLAGTAKSIVLTNPEPIIRISSK